MATARFNSTINITIIAVLLLVGGALGYWIANANQQKTREIQQFNRKVLVAGHVQAALTGYQTCLNTANAQQEDIYKIDCERYAGDLDINLMAAKAYFHLDKTTQQNIETVLSRSDIDTLDSHTQTLIQQVLAMLNQETQSDKARLDL